MPESRRSACFLTIAILASLLAALNVGAQQLDPGLYSGLRWRMLGPFRAGRVNAVSGVPGQSDTFYFGSVGGGAIGAGVVGIAFSCTVGLS